MAHKRDIDMLKKAYDIVEIYFISAKSSQYEQIYEIPTAMVHLLYKQEMARQAKEPESSIIQTIN